VFKKSSRINSTWGGNLVDMIRFSIIKKIIIEEKLVENAEIVGNYFIEQLKSINANMPLINPRFVRGRGLMIAFDFTSSTRDSVHQTLEDNGLLALKSGTKSIRLRPHLDFKKEEADLAIEIIKKSLPKCQFVL
jgi:L-lysine 6-transaminase